MPTTCIVVANHSLARLFHYDRASREFIPLTTMRRAGDQAEGPAAALAGPAHRDSDRESGRGRFAPRDNERRHLHDTFAHEIAAALKASLAAGAYQSLWLLAGNPFLGELKAALGDPVAATLQLALPIDLTHLGLQEIEDRLHALPPRRGHGLASS